MSDQHWRRVLGNPRPDRDAEIRRLEEEGIGPLDPIGPEGSRYGLDPEVRRQAEIIGFGKACQFPDDCSYLYCSCPRSATRDTQKLTPVDLSGLTYYEDNSQSPAVLIYGNWAAGAILALAGLGLLDLIFDTGPRVVRIVWAGYVSIVEVLFR